MVEEQLSLSRELTTKRIVLTHCHCPLPSKELQSNKTGPARERRVEDVSQNDVPQKIDVSQFFKTHFFPSNFKKLVESCVTPAGSAPEGKNFWKKSKGL